MEKLAMVATHCAKPICLVLGRYQPPPTTSDSASSGTCGLFQTDTLSKRTGNLV